MQNADRDDERESPGTLQQLLSRPPEELQTRPGSVQLSGIDLRWDEQTIDLRRVGSPRVVLTENDRISIQLSRQTRAGSRNFLSRLLARPATRQDVAVAEIRSSHHRLRLAALADQPVVRGLPLLDGDAPLLSLPDLESVLTTARQLGGRLAASGIRTQRQPRSSVGELPAVTPPKQPSRQMRAISVSRLQVAGDVCIVVDRIPGQGSFSTIGAAVRAAPEGARIVVHAGRYGESVDLTKSVMIVGEGEVVVAGSPPLQRSRPNGLVSIRGLSLVTSPPTDAPIYLTGETALHDCSIRSDVVVRRPGELELKNCTLRGGLISLGVQAATLEGCRATATLRLEQGRFNISGCTFSRCLSLGRGAFEISDCVVDSHGQEEHAFSADGVELTMRNSRLRARQALAMRLENSTTRLEELQIETRVEGIRVEGGDLVLADCTIQSGFPGLRATGARCAVHRCRFPGGGIAALSSELSLLDSTLPSGGSLVLGSGSRCQASDLVMEGPRGASTAILSDSSTLSLSRALVSEYARALLLTGEGACVVEGSRFVECASTGVELRDNAHAALTDSRIEGSMIGVAAYGDSRCSLTGCVVESLGQPIEAARPSAVTVTSSRLR